jgi:hypothetical protein
MTPSQGQKMNRQALLEIIAQVAREGWEELDLRGRAWTAATAKLLPEIKGTDPSHLRQGVLSEAERSGLLALHAFLREKDPHHQRLGLKRVPT